MKKTGWLFAFLLICFTLITLSAANAEGAFSLPKSLKSIGEEAFAGTGIEEVQLPESVVTVEWGAFANNEALRQITVSENTNLRSGSETVFYRETVSLQNPGSASQLAFSHDDFLKVRAVASKGEEKRNLRELYCFGRSSEDGVDDQRNIRPRRARKIDEGASFKPQERADIHAIDCHFP